jgi:conjugative relaxase-like TrwC/TraI family protein
MLDISKPLNAGQAQTYHKMDYTSPTQSYYTQGEAVKGEWQGKLAESMGLSGEVSAQEFSRLTEGRHPLTDEQMVRHRIATEYTNADGSVTKAVAHRAGWDAMFAPAKSVSLTALVGGDDRIREAHRAAVTTALDELEKYTHARIGGNNPAERTGRFVVAKFEHDTARPVDGYAAPQLHTHAVIFNVTQRADGATRALQEQPFFESQNFVTAVYQSELMYRLRSLGYEIEPGKSGAPEIKGYSQEYLTASSLRREKIKEEMERRGVSGPEAAEIAARSTRERKHTLTPAEVLAAHREVAAEFGNQPEKVVAEARERARLNSHTPDQAAHAREAVSYARASLFEREAVLDERLLMRDALRRGMGETTYQQVRSEFESRREAGAFLSVEARKHDSGRSFTTAETIAAERENLAYVQSGRNSVEPMMSAERAQRQANTRDFLNDSQRRVIEEVLNSPDRIHGLQGRAGSGKTTVLLSVREGAEQSGYVVEGFAPTSRAAGQLREAGIHASTLQSFLARASNGNADPDVRHLYIVDESSLASTRQMRDFLNKLTPNDRVLLIGDTRQHQGVDAGRPFQQMQEAGMRTSELNRIMRQKDAGLLKAVEHLSKNETREGISLLQEQGRITELTDRRDRIAAIAKDYADRSEGTIVVSPDNRSRQEINEAIRDALIEKGAVSKDQHSLQVLSHRSDMTGADRTWAARYNIGDVLEYSNGSKAHGIERGTQAAVRAVDARTNTLTVELANGETVAYDPKRLRGVNVFQEQVRDFATGDRLQFVSPIKKQGIANRDLGTIMRISNDQMAVRMDGRDQREIELDLAKVRQFDHGYAVTSHSSQGITATRVLAHFDTDGPRLLINSRLAYVAISRASEDAHVYTNDAITLGRRLSVDVSKTAAIELGARPDSLGREPEKDGADKQRPPAESETTREVKMHEFANRELRLASVALAYVEKRDRAVVVAFDPDERRELTTLIRSELADRGWLGHNSRSISVVVEHDIGNRRLAASYHPGDQIRYKSGSPKEHGIAHGSTVTVTGVDSKANLLTVATVDGSEVTFNPALLKRMTDQSQAIRVEERAIAEGERVRFTGTDPNRRIRAGDLATVLTIGDSGLLSVKHDNGAVHLLIRDTPLSIEHGYVSEGLPNRRLDRVLVTGSIEEVSLQRVAVNDLASRAHEISVFQAAHGGLRQFIEPKELSSSSPHSIAMPVAEEIAKPSFGLGR